MRRFTIGFGLCASVMAVFLACGSDGATVENDRPDASVPDEDGGAKTLPEASTNEPKDSGPDAAAKPISEIPSGTGGFDGGECTPVEDESTTTELAGDGAKPETAAGGAVTDGTYVITSAKANVSQALVDTFFPDGKPQINATLKLSGKKLEFVADVVFNGNTQHGELAGDFTAQGTALGGKASCPEERDINIPYTSAGGTLTTWLLFDAGAAKVAIEITLQKQ